MKNLEAESKRLLEMWTRDAEIDLPSMCVQSIDDTLTLNLFATHAPVPLTKFLEASLGVFGVTGSGKSMSLRRILEQLAFCRIPMSVIDKEGEFVTLRDRFPGICYVLFRQELSGDIDMLTFRGKKPQIERVTFREKKKIIVDGAPLAKLSRSIFLGGRMCVLDLSEIGNPETTRKLAYHYISGIKQASDALYRQDLKLHHFIVLDESHRFVPSQWSDFYKSSSDTIKDLTELISTIASMARKRGIVLCLAAQRITHVSHDTLANVQQFILQRSIGKRDRETYYTYLSSFSSNKNRVLEDIKALKAGEGFYVYKDIVYSIRMRMGITQHKGFTPKPSDSFRTLDKIRRGEIQI